jgi:hypothetical protein
MDQLEIVNPQRRLRIEDPGFWTRFRRFAALPKRSFDGRTIVVDVNDEADLDFTIHFAGAFSSLLSIDYHDGKAWIVPGSSLLRHEDLFLIEDALDYQVERFLRRHRLIPRVRRSTTKQEVA